MDVILVIANLFKFNVISLRDFLRNITDSERYLVGKERFTIFNGKDDVVVGIVCIVACFVYGHAYSLV